MFEQKTNPKIEDCINDALNGETQKNALDFVAFLRANEFIPEGYNCGSVLYKGEHIGFMMIRIDENELWFWFNTCDFGGRSTAEDDLKEFAWAHTVICPQSPCVEGGCETKQKCRNTIFGREYESTCHSPLAFFNPDVIKLENIKKLLLLLKQNRSGTQCTE